MFFEMAVFFLLSPKDVHSLGLLHNMEAPYNLQQLVFFLEVLLRVFFSIKLNYNFTLMDLDQPKMD